MKHKLYLFFLLILKYLVNLAIFFDLPLIVALLWILTLRRYKRINIKKKFVRVLILEKSFGIEDIYASYEKKISNIKFYYFPRFNVKVVYEYFLGKYNLGENNYNINKGIKVKKDKIKCQKFFERTLYYLNNIFKIKGFISFNFRYFTEIEFQKATVSQSLKFLTCHKESLLTKSDIISYKKLLGKGIGEYQGSKVTVYNELFKRLLVDYSIVKKENIKKIGMPRADKLFKIHKDELKEDYILVLLIDKEKGFALTKETKGLVKEKNSIDNWNTLSLDTIRSVIKVAKKFPNEKFIFKSKIDNYIGSINQINTINKTLPKNCKIITSGSGIELIKCAKAVIGFNTTGILEAGILNKITIVPLLNLNMKKFKDHILKMDYKIHYYPKNIYQFQKILIKTINKEIKRKKYKLKKNDLIDYYLGNIDGKSGKNLFRVINNLFLN